MRTAPTLFTLALILCIVSCRQRNAAVQGEDDLPSAASPFSYEEGDTLRLLKGQAPNLEEWLRFHSEADSGWILSRFQASGVNIHIDSMDPAPPLTQERMMDFAPLLAWSPDSSRSIDLWSYNRLMEKGTDGRPFLLGGGPDQMVALSDRSGTLRRQLMFNGPMQVAETADWLSPDAFLLGMLNLDEKEGTFVPEIMLFDLADSVFTNFRYPGTMPLDRLPGGDKGFVEAWIKGRGVGLR